MGAIDPWSTIVPAQSKTTSRTVASAIALVFTWDRLPHDHQKSLQRRRFQVWDLRLFVPQAQPDGLLKVRMLFEVAGLAFGERPSLQLQTEPRGVRQARVIRGIDGAAVALCRDMQTNRLDDVGTKVSCEPFGSQRFVPIVDSFFGAVFPQVVQQVTHVM
jgi:hypothetical protein